MNLITPPTNRKFYIILFLLLIFFNYLTPVTAAAITIDDTLKYKSIGLELEYLTDKEGILKFGDVADENKSNALNWIKSDTERPGFGLTNDVYWVRFNIKNSAAHKISWLLEEEYPMLDYVDLYYPDGKGVYRSIKTGDYYPFSKRPVQYRSFIFPLELEPKSEKKYYMRFYTTGPLNIYLGIWSPDYFHEQWVEESIFFWMFYGIMLIMFLYNIFIFFSIRNLSYLYCVLYIIALCNLLMSLFGHGFHYIWPNWIWWENFSVPITLGMIGIFILQFLRYYVDVIRANRFFNTVQLALIYIYSVLVLLTIILGDVRFGIVSTVIVYIVMIPFLLVMATYVIAVYKSRQTIFALVSFLFLAIGGFLFSLKAFGVLPDIFFTRYGIHIGIVMNVLLLSFALADNINAMKNTIQKAEKKYRYLVESSDDIIFSLDDDLRIISINNTVRKHLGFKVEDLIETDFLDLIEETWSERINIARQIVEEYIKDLKKNKKSIAFRTSIKTKLGFEPKELVVKLEYTGTDETGYSILGKASQIIDDVLLHFLKNESFIYTLDNYINNAEVMSQRLCRNLNRYLPPGEITSIRVALRESIVNAIEHGNLNLTFDEKTESQFNDTYHDLVRERQKNPVCKKRKVTVEYSFSRERVAFMITDEGDGFDHSTAAEEGGIGEDGSVLYHGRGLIMIRATFDEVKFNDKGNQVLLVKFLTPGRDSPFCS